MTTEATALHSVSAPVWTCLGCRKQFTLDLSKTELSSSMSNSNIHKKKSLAAPKPGFVAGFSVAGVGASSTTDTHHVSNSMVPTGTIQLPVALHDHYATQAGCGRTAQQSITPYSWYGKEEDQEEEDSSESEDSASSQGDAGEKGATPQRPTPPPAFSNPEEEVVAVEANTMEPGDLPTTSTVIMMENTPPDAPLSDGRGVHPPALTAGGGSSAPTVADHTKRALAIRLAGKELMDRIIHEDKETDYPLCPRCWQQSLERSKKTVDVLNQEVGAMRTFLEAPTNALSVCAQFSPLDSSEDAAMSTDDLPAPIAAELAAVQKELDAAEQEEQELLKELAAIEAELAEENVKHAIVDGEHDALIQEEDQVAGQLNDVLASEWLWHHEQESQSSKMNMIEDEIMRLCRFHSLRTLFEIRTDRSPIPTIKNLRLGKLGNVQVPPVEINSACGCVLHLLNILAKRNNFEYPRAKLRCRGVESTLEVHTGPANAKAATKVNTLDFYIKNKFFSWSTFGAGCVAFASCVNSLMDFLEKVLKATYKAVEGTPAAATSKEAAVPAATAGGGGGSTPAAPANPQVEDKLANLRPGTPGFDQLQKLQAGGPPRSKNASADQLPLINGFSIQYGVAGDETWTKAMKGCFERIQWCVQVDGVLHEPELDEDEVYGYGPQSPASNEAPQGSNEAEE